MGFFYYCIHITQSIPKRKTLILVDGWGEGCMYLRKQRSHLANINDSNIIYRKKIFLAENPSK